MKALKDVSLPYFIPTENLHTTRSNPTSKASSTIYLNPERVNRSNPSSRRSSEGAYAYSEEHIRELLPRPEPDSRALTPEPASKAMGLRGSGTISPLSDGSINDLIQSMPDSPVSEQPLGAMQADFKWKTWKKIHRIDISESSLDEPMGVFLPLSNASNAASTFPAIQTVTSNQPTVVVPNLPPLTFDGSASIATITKDFSHAPGDCPTISEADESQREAGLPLKIESVAKIAPDPPITNNGLPLSTLENIPMVDGNSLKHKLNGATEIAAASVVPVPSKTPGPQSLHPIPVMPGLPVDAKVWHPFQQHQRQTSTRSRNLKSKGRN